jgi:hypothetical protein
MREFSEDNYYKDFCDLQSKIKSSKSSHDKREIKETQKQKFQYITTLVDDLFDHKNSQKAYNTISNLIVTSLTSFDDNLPADLFSGKREQQKEIVEEKEKDVLVKEFRNDIIEYQNIMNKGRMFVDIINRFSAQYEVVNNIIFSPTLDKSNNGMPN